MPRGQRITFRHEDLAWSDKEGWVTVPFKGLPWGISVKVAEVYGVPQIVGLQIHGGPIEVSEDREHLSWRGPKGQEPTITTDLLRKLPLRQLREVAVIEGYATGRDWLEPFKTERPPEGWPDEHYEAVARVYREASGAPLKAISERWSVSRPTASTWVRKARELKYLGYPKGPGVAGASERKSPIKRAKKRGRKS